MLLHSKRRDEEGHQRSNLTWNQKLKSKRKGDKLQKISLMKSQMVQWKHTIKILKVLFKSFVQINNFARMSASNA